MDTVKLNPGIASIRPGTSATDKQPGIAGDFKKALGEASQVGGHQAASVTVPSTLKFSNHAAERMQSRGLRFDPETLTKIESKLKEAAAKGAKNTLVLTDSAAMVASSKNNTVITVMDRAYMKDNVFTNIDSTVFI